MLQKILVFLYPGCAEFEITVACWQIAESEKYEIITIAYEYDPISTNSGFSMIPDILVSDIQSIENIAGIIIPGGSLLDLRLELLDLLQKLDSQNILLAAICAGPQYLAAADILKARNFTTSRSPERYIELGEHDPFNWDKYQDKRIVIDGNLITAQGYAFSDFALAIWDYLGIISSNKERSEWMNKFFPRFIP